jgi:hypothetical protein
MISCNGDIGVAEDTLSERADVEVSVIESTDVISKQEEISTDLSESNSTEEVITETVTSEPQTTEDETTEAIIQNLQPIRKGRVYDNVHQGILQESS